MSGYYIGFLCSFAGRRSPAKTLRRKDLNITYHPSLITHHYSLFTIHCSLSKDHQLPAAVVVHGDGEGDGVYLVVVGAVREAAGFLYEVFDPRAADEAEAAVGGERLPFEGTRLFVALDLNAFEASSLDLDIAAEFLHDGVAVEGELDAVLGVAFEREAFGDVAFLLGESDASPKSAVDVKVVVLVVSDAETGGVIGGLFGRNGKIVAAFPVEARGCVVDDVRKPFPLEHAALRRHRTLLIQSSEREFALPSADLLEMPDSVHLRPESLAGRAAERVGVRVSRIIEYRMCVGSWNGYVPWDPAFDTGEIPHLNAASASAGRLTTSHSSPPSRASLRRRPARSSSCQRVWMRTIEPPGSSRV